MNAITGSAPAGGLSRAIGGIAVLVLGAVALYYLYQYLYGQESTNYKAIITNAMKANPATRNTKKYDILPLTEGGAYSVSFWVYLTGYKDQAGLNKHVLELYGDTFSTLVVGLGAYTNKLMVRVSSEATGSQSLTSNSVKTLFEQRQTPGSNLGEEQLPLCDLPEVDLQRWVCISIVLDGKTTDVYLDGKLARSCVNRGQFRVDSGGVSMRLVDYNGFDGFISDVYVYEYALNPEQAYRIYMAGPSEVQSAGFLSWLKGMFDVQGTVTYKYPAVGVSYPSAELTF